MSVTIWNVDLSTRSHQDFSHDQRLNGRLGNNKIEAFIHNV